MKLLTVLLMLSGSEAMAEKIICSSVEFPDRIYSLTGQFPSYTFTVSQVVVDPVTWRSRWGCDEVEELIYQEKMIAEDWQGEFLYKGKRSEIYFPSEEDVTYYYSLKTTNGDFVTKAVKLTCKKREWR